MASDSKHIDNLIARYLAGETTAEERARLEEWMNASEENRKYFGDIRFVHDKAVASHRIERVDAEKAWDNVRRQMQQIQPSPSVTAKTVKLNLWIRVAAVFVVVLGLSFWLYQSFLSKTPQPMSVASQNNTFTYKLADSSQVFLNKHSKITYAKGFGKKQREVTLSGEAYFKVVHSAEKPFTVEAEGTLVKDIGTSFNIKAYAGDSIVEVYVESGQVAFFTRDNPGILLFKGEKGTFEKATRKFRKFLAAEPNILSYKTKVLVFQDADLQEVVEKLNAIYQTRITLGNNKLMNCKITVTFDNESIDAVLGIISETLGLMIVKTDDGYRLEGESCNSR